MLLSAQDGRSRFEGASGDLKPESELSRGPWNERNYTDDPPEKGGHCSREVRQGQKCDGGECSSPWGSPRGRLGGQGVGGETAERGSADARLWTGLRGA